jgi:hypothetical protein
MKTSKPLTAGILGAIFLFSPLAIAAPPIPSEVQMVQPDSSLPKGLGSFWGNWEGRGIDYGQGKEIEFVLIFEKITEEKASLFTWHTVHGWSPRREANVTKQGGEYKLFYKGQFGTNEMVLQGDELVFDAQREGKSSWFTLKLKRIP